MRNRRVLVCLTYYLPNISGVTIYAGWLAKALKKDGYKVTLLTSKFRDGLKEEEVADGVKIIRSKVGLKWGKGVVMPNYLIDSLRAVVKNDVVNCHLPQLESVVVAWWAKIFRKKLIVTHHCQFSFDGNWQNKVIAVISFPFHLVTYWLSDKIVAYTKDYAEKAFFLKIFRKKIVFILPPVRRERLDKQIIEDLKKRVGCDSKTKIVAYVGRISWEKGLDVLIKAVAEIRKKRKVKLVLVGPYKNVVGDKSMRKLQPLMEKYRKWIVPLGPIQGMKVLSNFYRLTDCLVLPSTNNLETFGLVQAEAMVVGCPVVASDLPGVRVPIRLTGMGRIADVGDNQDLAKKIDMVLEKKPSKVKTERARRIFDNKKTLKKYGEMLGMK